MLEIRPFQTPHKIIFAKNPTIDSWKGARKFALSSEFNEQLVTRQEYDEKGGEYFKDHTASNLYFPTPAPIVTEPSTE